MQLQGYIEPIARSQRWRTTEEGITVCGAKTARFTRAAVEQALSVLQNRIQAINNDKKQNTLSQRPLRLVISYPSNLVFRLRLLASGLRRERPIQTIRARP
jgi:hypothetical protein